MAARYPELSKTHINFVEEQHLFFVGTAADQGRVNVSPKGMDSLRVLGPNRLVWLNLTGSGNETAAHMRENSRMTVMFCSFSAKPLILRVYGTAEAIHNNDDKWDELTALFPHHPARRQIFDLTIDLVQTSCGFGVPVFDLVEHRNTLAENLKKKEQEGIENYWRKKNTKSIDDKETGISDVL